MQEVFCSITPRTLHAVILPSPFIGRHWPYSLDFRSMGIPGSFVSTGLCSCCLPVLSLLTSLLQGPLTMNDQFKWYLLCDPFQVSICQTNHSADHTQLFMLILQSLSVLVSSISLLASQRKGLCISLVFSFQDLAQGIAVLIKI